MIIKYNTYNESVRDKMTPKSIEDIKKKLDDLDDLLELFAFGCEKKQGFIIKYALESGLDIHEDRDAPLRIACRYGCKNTVKYLLEHGADVHAANDDALMWAYELDDSYITDLLYKYGAKLPDTNESVKDLMVGKDINVIDKTVYDRMNRYPKLGTFDWKKWGWTIDYEDIYGTTIDSYFFIDPNDKKYLINLTEDDIELRRYPYKVGRRFSNYEDLDDYLDFYYNERTTYYDKFDKKTNESLHDSLENKIVDHITNVKRHRRYNFIEPWANDKKYRNHVGYIVIDDEFEDELYLSSFTIWEPYKGKGLGRKYLNIVLDDLKQLDYSWVGLSVRRDNEIAIKLYRSVGFRNESEVDEYNGPGKNYKNKMYYYMVKENK
jgi:ribosomal protein S18 acetylase RimI-like enzyme